MADTVSDYMSALKQEQSDIAVATASRPVVQKVVLGHRNGEEQAVCNDRRHCATRGVKVSMSAFLACHQCYCADTSLAWGLNLRAVVSGIF